MGPVARVQIDVHAHYTSPEYAALMRETGAGEADVSLAKVASSLAADLETRFRTMETAGMDVQILSASTLQPYLSDRENAVAAARLANDGYAELVRAHPARLAAFATLPLPHLDASLTELTRALDELGMVGVGITTAILGRSPADALFDPLWAELDRRGTVLFVHPAGFACGAQEIAASKLRMPLGGTLEDTLCAVRLIERGFQTAYPRIRVILAHLGGSLPFLLHRFERMARTWPEERERPSVAARRYWYDTVNGHPAALRCSCETFGAERLVLGTDYPYWSGEAHAWAVRYVEESGLPGDVVDGILRRNAAALFPGRFSEVVAGGR